jgi:hypothetical protein
MSQNLLIRTLLEQLSDEAKLRQLITSLENNKPEIIVTKPAVSTRLKFSKKSTTEIKKDMRAIIAAKFQSQYRR